MMGGGGSLDECRWWSGSHETVAVTMPSGLTAAKDRPMRRGSRKGVIHHGLERCQRTPPPSRVSPWEPSPGPTAAQNALYLEFGWLAGSRAL